MSRTPQVRRSRLRAFRRAVSWHRRKLAVVLAVLTVLTGVSAALPPDPPSQQVVRAVGRVDAGVTLARDDLELVRLPVEAVPDGALQDLTAAVGRSLAAPVAKGAVLTELAVASPAGGLRPGHVVAPLRLADADVAGLLRVGSVLDVVAADDEAPRAAVVARAVRVVSIPQPAESSGVGGSVSSASGALVLVDVTDATATTLAQAAVTATLSVVLR